MNVARAPSPAKVVLGLELRVHPQSAIIFRLLNQPCLYRILSDVFAFLLQTLIRPQHMIEGFLFPDRTGSVKQLIDTMSSRALQTLQNVHERIRPALFIAEWQEKHMDVVGHDYGCIEMNPVWRGRPRPRTTGCHLPADNVREPSRGPPPAMPDVHQYRM